MHINAGIRDGHEGSVPISHSLYAFNLVAKRKDRLSEEDIDFFRKRAKVPPHLIHPLSDPNYGEKQPLFRRQSGSATITLFDGGHELIASAAIDWIQSQYQTRVE